ncbi:lipoprotein intramolecular transacylase Lit [Slackia isoflavoniconvertens]|uniref:lipoprotein intramolecular transacylase Lit n=1 Tax=Slackia isoflavoniconvertens TaxID=572010 RepID=UPI003F9B1D4E
MAKSESSSRIVTSVVAVISAAALAVSLIAAGFAACAVPDVSTKALASAYSTDDASPFTKDELVAAAVQTKHYTIDDNDKAAVYATIAAINAQEALAGTAGKGAPKIDATANYAAGELSGEQVAALETAFDAASERYVLTPDAVRHLDDVFGVVQAAKWWLLAAVVAACVGCTATAFRGGKRLLGRVLAGAGVSVLALFALLAAWVAIDFDGFFAQFHSLFFAAGTWTFSWDSLLICMYPPEFWVGMGAIWLVVTVACCVVCITIGRLLRKGSTQKR